MNEDVFYWNLTLKDGRVIPIPPKGVAIVQRKMAAREPIITNESTIPFSEIRGFDKSSRRLAQQSLLPEEVAQAFDEPIITKDKNGLEMVKARWVKKQVTTHEYAKQYAKNYRRLGDTDGGMVWVAFVMPVHKIDTRRLTYCTTDDIKTLER